MERNLRGYRCSPTRSRFDPQRAAEDRRALAQRREAETWCIERRHVETAAVIAYRHAHACVFATNLDRDPRRVGVPERIRQRFLDEPVEGQLELRREKPVD